MPEPLEALALVLGWPYLGSVEPAGTGIVLLRHERGAAGLELATGTRTAELPAPEPAPVFLTLGSSRLVERHDRRHGTITTWTTTRGRRRELYGIEVKRVIAGDDDHLVIADSVQLRLVERASPIQRTLDVPRPPELRDIVTGGAGGYLPTPILAVAPDYLVFVRSPALLVVRLPDVVRALRGERVDWHLRNCLPLRERVLDRDRLWLPEGFADRVKPPADHRRVATVACTEPTDPDRALRVDWHATAGALPAVRTRRASPYAVLASVAVPATAAEGIAVARELRLDERTGAYGPVARAYDRLTDLTSSDPEDADERRIEAYHDLLVGTLWHQGTIYEATGFAIPALVGILRDPATLDRERIAGVLALIAIAAGEGRAGSGQDPAVATCVQLAFARCLPALLQPPVCTAYDLAAWRRMLLAIASFKGRPAMWFRRIAKADREARELLDRLTDDEDLYELVHDNEAL